MRRLLFWQVATGVWKCSSYEVY